jgi:hypothetical protein
LKPNRSSSSVVYRKVFLRPRCQRPSSSVPRKARGAWPAFLCRVVQDCTLLFMVGARMVSDDITFVPVISSFYDFLHTLYVFFSHSCTYGHRCMFIHDARVRRDVSTTSNDEPAWVSYCGSVLQTPSASYASTHRLQVFACIGGTD